MHGQEIALLDGAIPPEWVTNHSALKSREIVLGEELKLGSVWRTPQMMRNKPPYAVKVLDNRGTEAAFYDELLRHSNARRNHTLPIVYIDSSVLIMPLLSNPVFLCSEWDLATVLDFFMQVLEGVEFLHSLRIAHLDIYPRNILWAEEKAVKWFSELGGLKTGRVYLIDYERSAHYPEGPGRQAAIDLPVTATEPPLGMKRFDPYSWDMYCVGDMFDSILYTVYDDGTRHRDWLADRLVKWMIGKERGCTGVCHCRPTARIARRVVQVVLFIVKVAAFRCRLGKWWKAKRQ